MMQSATLVPPGVVSPDDAAYGWDQTCTKPAPRPELLVVDDDASIREALADVLGDEGYSVVAHADGEDALAQLRAGYRPKAVILDLWMPRLDGWSFQRALEADPQLASIPVVVLTACSTDIRPEPRGVRAVLRKPVPLRELLMLIRSLF